MFKKVALILSLVVVAAGALEAQVSLSAVPFLLIAPNSRASGMGETGGALADDAWAQFWNPGGLAFQTGGEVAISHANWLPQFNLGDLWVAHLVGKQRVEELDGTVSLGLTYMNLGTFDRTVNDPTPIEQFKAYEFAITAGYATKLSDALGLGVNTRFIYSHLSDFGAGAEKGAGVASGISFDFGLLYKPAVVSIPFTDVQLENFLNIGLNISNIGPELTYIDQKQADPLPMNFRLSFAFNVMQSEYNSLTAVIDFNKLLVSSDTAGHRAKFYQAFFQAWTDQSLSETISTLQTSFGLEYWYGSPKLIALRMGYFYEDPKHGNRKFMTFGAGIRYDVYGLDFSYINTVEDLHPLANTLRFTVLITF